MSRISERDLLDLTEYRVHIVRLWGGSTSMDEKTGKVFEGQRRANALVDVRDATDLHEFQLFPHEYIVAVRGREGRWIDRLELETVCHRVFRVGGTGGDMVTYRAASDKEVRFLNARVDRNITNLESWVAPARFSLSPVDSDSLYQFVLRHPAFRVSIINMWSKGSGFTGLQFIFQRGGASWCNDVKPTVSATLKKDEFVAMTLCRVDDCDHYSYTGDKAIMELRLRTNHGRSISCGVQTGWYMFACHTLANSEVRGLRIPMKYNSAGISTHLDMHEIRRTDKFNAAAFDADFAAILLHAVSPDSAAAAGVALPESYEDDQQDDIDFEDEMFKIPLSVYARGIPSIRSVESSKKELEVQLDGVRRNSDECYELVHSIFQLYEKILALHKRQIAYDGLLVLRLMDLLKETTAALEKSSNLFSFSGQNKRIERFTEVNDHVSELKNYLKKFTTIEVNFAKHVMAEGNNVSLDGIIAEKVVQDDWQTACELFIEGSKTLPLETARDTLLITCIQKDDLASLKKVLRASMGEGAGEDKFQINQDGRTLELADHKHPNYHCRSCDRGIFGLRYRSIRSGVYPASLCKGCWSRGKLREDAPFVLAIDPRRMRFVENDSLLTVAVGVGACRIVEWLLCDFGLDPFAPTVYGCSAVEFCNNLTSLDEEQRDRMHLMMTQYKRRRDHMRCRTALLKCSTITYDDLVPLVNSISSVYDLRTVYTFGSAYLQPADMKRALVQAFEVIMTEKLVLDNDASDFFDMVLRECKKRKLLDSLEFLRWGRQNIRVNMENAVWVKEIKQSISKLSDQVERVDQQLDALQRNVSDLRNALIAKEEAETRQKTCKRIVGMMCMGLSLIAGPAIEQLFSAAIDFAVPVKLLGVVLNMDENDVAEFLADKVTDYVINDKIGDVLTKALINPAEFVDILREVVVFEQTGVTLGIASKAAAEQDESSLSIRGPTKKEKATRAAASTSGTARSPAPASGKPKAQSSKPKGSQGSNDRLDATIAKKMSRGKWQEACDLFFDGVKKFSLETARDTLLIDCLKEDDLEYWKKILDASVGEGASGGQFQINEDGRTMELAGRKYGDFFCDSCEEAIIGLRYRSIRSDNYDLCEDCWSRKREVTENAPFVIGIGQNCKRFVERDSLLTVAIGFGACSIVEWLLRDFGLDPSAPTLYRCSAAELCNGLSGKQRKRIQKLLTQYGRDSSTAGSPAPASAKPKALSPNPNASFSLDSIDEFELDEYEFHRAVYNSEGDLGRFEELLETVDDDSTLNDTMKVDVIHKGKPLRVRVQPQVLASYLGYVEITEYFFEHMSDLTPEERKGKTIGRARAVAGEYASAA